MCGFAGIWKKRLINSNADDIGTIVQAMSQTLLHRGPDGQGHYVDKEHGIALAHTRLAIQDLSEHGHQPMLSPDNRYSLVFNGEIYNHRSIRVLLSELHTIDWQGHSDTEVLLQSIIHLGFDATLQKVEGMFAFALWDRQLKRLTLARDRFGEKPLYYGISQDYWLFASELKAIKAFPNFEARIDRNALEQFFTFNYIPAPLSIYQGIKKLLPGHYVHINQVAQDLDSLKPCAYWSAKDEAKRAYDQCFVGSFADAVNQLDDVLSDSVASQMESDVPLGAFLSGGLDSSLITALMQKQSSAPISTFTIGFHDRSFNEANQAKAIANTLKTNHTELYIEPEACLDFIQELPSVYDEPFADSSQLPMLLLSKLVRNHVTVALSGDGGDELFAGYNRYASMHYLKHVLPLPYQLRYFLSELAQLIPVHLVEKLIQPVNRQNIAVKWQKLWLAIAAKNTNQLYSGLLSRRAFNDRVLLGSSPQSYDLNFDFWNADLSDTEHMMLMDTLHYLPNDIMTKVDRASMTYSLETRAPFLNRQVFNFAWSLPLQYKIEKGSGKIILRKLLEKHISEDLLSNDKKGFAIPIDEWLRGPLKSWAEELLDIKKLNAQGYLDADKVHIEWQLHLSQKKNYGEKLWAILMFQLWLEKQ